MQSLQRRKTLSYWRRQLYGFDRQSTISEERPSRESIPGSEGVNLRQSRTGSVASGAGTPPRLTSEYSHEKDADASPAGQALGAAQEARGDDAASVSGPLMFVDKPLLRFNAAFVAALSASRTEVCIEQNRVSLLHVHQEYCVLGALSASGLFLFSS
jgi:hypothetical protein